MGIISEKIKEAEKAGYEGANLTAKVCQDIVLSGIAKSSLRKNIS